MTPAAATVVAPWLKSNLLLPGPLVQPGPGPSRGGWYRRRSPPTPLCTIRSASRPFCMHHPISYFQSVVLGLLQGFSELFPISSLGHAVVLPRVLGWNIHQNDKFFLAFLVAVHLATAVVLLGFFWQDWVRVARGIGRSLRDRDVTDDDARFGWLLVVATIPAGLLG